MATIAKRAHLFASERRFFLVMAIAIAGTALFGFGLDFWRFDGLFFSLPFHVHLHGATFTFWILFYVLQNWLVASGSVALHRRLGVLGGIVAALMVVLGITTTVWAIQMHRVPSFFPPGIFLALDVLGILGFGVLTSWAILLRRQADWHKRLMLCGTVLVMSPALGRILPMPLLGPFGPLAVFAAMSVYVLAGMAYDVKRRGRVHPAYWWGASVLIVTQVLVGPIGFSAPVLRVVEQLAA